MKRLLSLVAISILLSTCVHARRGRTEHKRKQKEKGRNGRKGKNKDKGRRNEIAEADTVNSENENEVWDDWLGGHRSNFDPSQHGGRNEEHSSWKELEYDQLDSDLNNAFLHEDLLPSWVDYDGTNTGSSFRTLEELNSWSDSWGDWIDSLSSEYINEHETWSIWDKDFGKSLDTYEDSGSETPTKDYVGMITENLSNGDWMDELFDLWGYDISSQNYEPEPVTDWDSGSDWNKWLDDFSPSTTLINREWDEWLDAPLGTIDNHEKTDSESYMAFDFVNQYDEHSELLELIAKTGPSEKFKNHEIELAGKNPSYQYYRQFLDYYDHGEEELVPKPAHFVTETPQRKQIIPAKTQAVNINIPPISPDIDVHQSPSLQQILHLMELNQRNIPPQEDYSLRSIRDLIETINMADAVVLSDRSWLCDVVTGSGMLAALRRIVSRDNCFLESLAELEHNQEHVGNGEIDFVSENGLTQGGLEMEPRAAADISTHIDEFKERSTAALLNITIDSNNELANKKTSEKDRPNKPTPHQSKDRSKRGTVKNAVTAPTTVLFDLDLSSPTASALLHISNLTSSNKAYKPPEKTLLMESNIMEDYMEGDDRAMPSLDNQFLHEVQYSLGIEQKSNNGNGHGLNEKKHERAEEGAPSKNARKNPPKRGKKKGREKRQIDRHSYYNKRPHRLDDYTYDDNVHRRTQTAEDPQLDHDATVKIDLSKNSRPYAPPLPTTNDAPVAHNQEIPWECSGPIQETTDKRVEDAIAKQIMYKRMFFSFLGNMCQVSLLSEGCRNG